MNLLRLQGGLEAELSKQGVEVEWIGFPAGPQLLEALNAGSIDFGHTGDAPPILAQAAGVPFFYVATESARPGSEAIVVPAGSPIRSLADLKGRRVALNKGSNVHYLLVRALEEAGVAYDQIQAVFLPPADSRAAFEGGSVDAWSVWDPYFAEAEATAKARVLVDGKGLVANREFQLASQTLVRERPQVVRTIIEALRRHGRWAQEHPEDVAGILSAELGLDVEWMRKVVGRKRYGIEPIDDAIIAEQQRIADTFARLGLIPHRITVRDLVAPGVELVADRVDAR
jgi:sulfonate transport system substrate-binding protein